MEAINALGANVILGISLAVSIIAVSICWFLINRFGLVDVDFHVQIKVKGKDQ